MKFVYTRCVDWPDARERASSKAGFTNYELVEEEAAPNGDFPGLKNPNPEFPEAFVGNGPREESRRRYLNRNRPGCRPAGLRGSPTKR